MVHLILLGLNELVKVSVALRENPIVFLLLGENGNSSYIATGSLSSKSLGFRSSSVRSHCNVQTHFRREMYITMVHWRSSTFRFRKFSPHVATYFSQCRTCPKAWHKINAQLLFYSRKPSTKTSLILLLSPHKIKNRPINSSFRKTYQKSIFFYCFSFRKSQRIYYNLQIF